MKARRRTHGGVAILAKAYSLHCDWRLALGTKSSLSFCSATSVLQYQAESRMPRSGWFWFMLSS
ncbi:hypothetical protein [Polaromonas sp.]|jgi:hypothetical protein|uniref:hypothetical protein n=1 Tax=Polaromonas sp. TaxID=1869339 RepID=UPI0026D2FBAD|nr:hypothetical protein [Polaromonas sp.]